MINFESPDMRRMQYHHLDIIQTETDGIFNHKHKIRITYDSTRTEVIELSLSNREAMLLSAILTAHNDDNTDQDTNLKLPSKLQRTHYLTGTRVYEAPL